MEATFQVRQIDLERPRETEIREVVAVPAEREDAAAARAEVLVDGCARAAVAALERRDVTNRNGIGSHGCPWQCSLAPHAPKELPQPQDCFAFGLWNTNPCVRSAVS